MTVTKVRTKMASARAYADAIYPNADVTVEVWSPVVPSGLVSQLVGCGGELVVNQRFADCVQELLNQARASTKLSGDDAFRLLQLLTHLRGAKDVRLR